MAQLEYRIPARFGLCLVINILSIMPAVCQVHDYEGYYLRSSERLPVKWTPACRLDDYSEMEFQGVTHDNDNWYFTWTHNSDPAVGVLWKIPVSVPLDNCVLGKDL